MFAHRKIACILIPIVLLTMACQAATRAWQAAFNPSDTPAPRPSATLNPTFSPTETSTSTRRPVTETASSPPTATLRPTVAATQIRRHLRVFEEIWNTVAAEYLYEDFNGVDWNAVYVEYRERISQGLSDEEFYLAMEELISGLGDEHSLFLNPEAAREEDAQFAGEYDYVGIGVLNTLIPEKRKVSIVLVFPGSPAEEAGLKAHDSILAVDGAPILGEDGLRSNLLRGPEGTSVVLTVQSPGEAPREVRVERRSIRGATPVPYEILITPSGKRIGYLLLVTFNDITIHEQVGDILRQMSASGRLDGLIIDNRQNGGGADTVMKGTLAYFARGTVGYFVNRQQEVPLNILGHDINGSQNLPIVVLIGRGTASFGEIFSGILQEKRGAYLIGEPTDGNVEILWVFEFSDGSRIWLAHDTFQPHGNPEANWEETGILPDEVVYSSWDEVTMENDPVIKTALEHFDQQ